MQLEYSMKIFFHKEKYEFINKNLFNIKKEENMGYFIQNPDFSGFNESVLIDLEKYIDEMYCKVDNLTKIKYIMFKLRKNIKKKFENIKKFGELVLLEEEKLLSIVFDYSFNMPFLNSLLEAEKIYRDKQIELNKFIENLYNVKEDFSNLYYAENFIKFYKGNAEKQLEIIKRIEEKHSPLSILRSLESVLNLEKILEKKVKDFIINKIAKISHEEIKSENHNPMQKLIFLEYAVKYYRIMGDKEKENECLILQQLVVEESKEDMKLLEIEIPDEAKEAQKKILDYLQESFGIKNPDFQSKISRLTETIFCEEGVIFSPYPVYESVKKIKSELEKDSLSSLVKTFSLAEDRRLPDKKDQDLKQIKLIYYEDHINKISYIFYFLKQDLNFKEENLRKILEVKLDHSDQGFLHEMLDSYFKEKSFGFTCMGVTFIEKILRKIYKQINQRDINTLNKSPEAQVKIKMTDVLNDLNVKKIVGENFIEYSKWLLNLDSEGLNIRNNVSHGFVEYNFYSIGLSDLILHYLINLIFLNKYLESNLENGEWKN